MWYLGIFGQIWPVIYEICWPIFILSYPPMNRILDPYLKHEIFFNRFDFEIQQIIKDRFIRCLWICYFHVKILTEKFLISLKIMKSRSQGGGATHEKICFQKIISR